MNTIINVECVDQDLIITNAPTLASGGICENIVSFKFCNKWDDFSKTAVFYQNEKNVFYSLINDQNECEIPYEVTMNEGTLHFGVFGVNGDTRRTSKIDKIRIHKGAWTKDMHPSDPSPDIYTQLVSEMNRVENLLQSLLNGTSATPVGNAKTLEGHGASYFATAQNVNDIINGTTPVGNALKLNGLTAEEYALSDEHNIKSYYMPEQIGCTYDSTLSEVWSALPSQSELYLQTDGLTDSSWNCPYGQSVIHMEKMSNVRPVSITIYPKSGTAVPMFMLVDNNGVPTGTWRKYADGGNADTVDGYHASGFAKSTTFYDSGDFVGMQNKKDNVLRRLQLHGENLQLWVSTDNGSTWTQKALFINSTGGTLSGNLALESNVGMNFSIKNTTTGRQAIVTNDTGNRALLRNRLNGSNVTNIILESEEVDANELIKLSVTKDGANKTYNVLHTGNSNAVIFTESSTTAPSDKNALWAHLD